MAQISAAPTAPRKPIYRVLYVQVLVAIVLGGLLGWLAAADALNGVDAAEVAALRFWKLGGGTTPGKATDPLLHARQPFATVAEHVAATQAAFFALCDTMLLGANPFVAKAHPDYARGTDYDQLARVLEWLGRP